MIRSHLFFIVFSALQLHVICSKNGLSNLPLMRHLAMGSGGTNGTVVSNQDNDYYGWRRLNGGNQMLGGNQTRRGNKETRFVTEFRSGGYGTRQRRPIQQLFYNIYIHNSPNINVYNAISTETASNPVRYGITNLRADISNRYVGDPPVSENSEMNAVGQATTGTELNRNVNTDKEELLLERTEKSSVKMDFVSSQISGINETGRNPTGKTPIVLNIVNVPSQFQVKSRDGANETIIPSENAKEVTVGNPWRVLEASTPSENKEIKDGIGNYQRSENKGSEFGDRNGNQNGRHGSPSNVIQIPYTASLNEKEKNHPLSESYQQQPRETNPIVAPDGYPVNGSRIAIDRQGQNRNRPSYGRHSYHEIMKNLNMKSEKNKVEKDGEERFSGE